MPSYNIDIDLDATDDNGIAEDQDLTEDTALDLDGVLGTSLDYARQLGIYSADNISTVNFTVVGLDANGRSISEVVTGINSSTVETVNYYKDITSITPDATSSSTVIVGTVDEAASVILPLDDYNSNPAHILVDISGTINFTVQETSSNCRDPSQPIVWENISALASKSADTSGASTAGVKGLRIIINSYSSGAELQMYVNQPYTVC